MRHIITLYSLLLLAFSSVAAQTLDTLYIYRSNGEIKRIAVASIDSMSFTVPIVSDDSGSSTEPSDTVTHPAAVDLGLSVKWASCNIGASSPLELGSVFAWGEVEEKDTFTRENYKWYDDSIQFYNKYCPDETLLITTVEGYSRIPSPYYDGKNLLEPEDDVATVKWGGNWRMPTNKELEELRTQCTLKLIFSSANEVAGFKIIGPNGNSIIIPYHKDPAHGHCYYWMNSGAVSDYNIAKGTIYFDEERKRIWRANAYARWRGLPVRPVCE